MQALLARPEFPETRWSLIQRLRQGTPDALGEKALADLCQMYWYPLYAFARRCGQAPPDAEDLTQGFFARLLERDLFAKADPSRGRLRSYLLQVFKYFMAEEWRKSCREKRGGGQARIPIHQLRTDPSRGDPLAGAFAVDPELLFDRVWFETLLEHALNELEKEYRQRGRAAVFLRLQPFLAWNTKDARLGDVARELQMSPGAVRVTILRMRERFRELIEAQIAETVGSPAEAAEELEHLRRVLRA